MGSNIIQFADRVTVPVLGYRMRVTCNGCCIEYHNYKPPIFHRKCDIKGSFTDFLPIIVDKQSKSPPVERGCSFRLYENNSTIGKPAVGFGYKESYHLRLKQLITRPILRNYEGPYDLKAFLQFTNGPMILKVRHFLAFFSGGKLLTASITATKG
jgi:hypothetical protein